MSYKTILVPLDDGKNLDLRIDLAIEIARAENAHLVAVATAGISRYVYESAAYGMTGVSVAPYLEPLREKARQLAQRFEQASQKSNFTDFECLVTDDDMFGAIERRIRYCDLLVLGQFDPATSVVPLEANLAGQVILEGGGPALIVPHATGKKDIGNRVLIAWNGSVESRRAVRDALPLLRRSAKLEAVVFQPDVYGEEPGENLKIFLGRHGIEVSVINQTRKHDTGEALLSLIADLGSDLLVMGGYGHSRFREILLGGVTRTVLQSMTVPVLMSR